MEDGSPATALSGGSSRFSALARSGEPDDRLFAVMRCLLAFAGLAIVYVDPVMPQRLVGANYGMLAAYCTFSLVVAADAFTRRRLPWRDRLHWADVLFASVLMYLSDATSSVFFFTYFFAIVLGSFSRGYHEGLRVVIVSLGLHVIVGVLPAPWLSETELDRALLRPVYLLVLGYMIAVWGGRQLLLKRRLLLLKEATGFDPRFGMEHALGGNLARLLGFYSADRVVLVLAQDEQEPRRVMYSLGPRDAAIRAYPLTAEAAQTLLACDHVHSILYDGSQWRSGGRLVCLPRASSHHPEMQPPSREACAAVAGLLEAPRFATVPCCEGDSGRGRLFVAATGTRFVTSDLDFLTQYVDTLATVVKNIRLLDELVREAAAHERTLLSYNLHDATIQPYVGLRLALEALQRDAGADNPLTGKIARLLDQATATIADLRSYTSALREGESVLTGPLASALATLTERFRRFYGLNAELQVDIGPDVDGLVGADVYYIVLEGLSNILKHTSARSAHVAIEPRNGGITITIASDGGLIEGVATPFSPRSITARAQALGGTVHAEMKADGSSMVRVSLPLDTRPTRRA